MSSLCLGLHRHVEAGQERGCHTPARLRGRSSPEIDLTGCRRPSACGALALPTSDLRGRFGLDRVWLRRRISYHNSIQPRRVARMRSGGDGDGTRLHVSAA